MNDVQLSNLINFGKAGLEVATYSQVRAALIARYKEVYGSDIDLSTGTADGVFVNDLSLIINNILQTVQSLYANLDIRTASGIYLDALCALANVSRKPATYSRASILVKNVGSADLTNIESLVFIDKSGKEWTYDGSLDLAVNETKEITVVCNELGAIEAPAGWIFQTLTVTTIQVTQESDAIVGRVEESDAELRARAISYSATTGLTTIDSLRSALLDVEGVRDVAIWNNNKDDSRRLWQAGFTIPAHAVAISIRKDDGVVLDDKKIADIIHERLTPGVRTTEYTESTTSFGIKSTGTSKSYGYIEQVAGYSIQESEQTVYWKEAKPYEMDLGFRASYAVELYIEPKDYFTTMTLPLIAQSVMDRFNNLPMCTDIRTTFYDVVKDAAYLADPKFNRESTYAVTKVERNNMMGSIAQNNKYAMTYIGFKHSKWERFDRIDAKNTTWVFNDTISAASWISTDFEFTSNGKLCTGLATYTSDMTYSSDEKIDVYSFSDDSWTDDAYKTIIINDDIDIDVYEWLQQNATMTSGSTSATKRYKITIQDLPFDD